MLSSKTVVLDVEGFRHRTKNVLLKNLVFAPRSMYLDCVSFFSPTSISELTTQQKQSFSWLTRILHGIEWATGNYPYVLQKHRDKNNSKRSLEEFGCNILS